MIKIRHIHITISWAIKMTVYFNMRELSRSIVFKRTKSLHNQEEKITIDAKKKSTLQQLLTYLGR